MLSVRNHSFAAAFGLVQLLFLVSFMYIYNDPRDPTKVAMAINCTPVDQERISPAPPPVIRVGPSIKQQVPCLNCSFPKPSQQDPPGTRRKGWILIDDNVGVLQCDEERVSKFKASNSQYLNTTTVKSKNLMSILRKASNILNKLNIPFFLTHGTLLGWYRECGIIRHTTDVDLGIPIDAIANKGDKVIKAFRAEGFELFNQFGTVKKGFELSFKQNQSKVDLFSFYKDIEVINGQQVDIIWNALSWEEEFIRRMWFPLERFVYVNMSGEIVLAPSNMLKWLELDYGENWYSPVSKWGWWDGPANYLDETDISRQLTFEQELSMFGPNLLKNPSFEEVDNDGRLLEWRQNGNPVITANSSNVFHGRRAVQMTNVRGAKKYTGAVSQELFFDITKPTKLLISGWAKKDRIHSKLMTNIDFMVYVDLYNHAGDRRWFQTWACFDQLTTEWQYKSKVLETSDLKKVKFWAYYRNQPGTAWFDDVSFRVSGSCPNKCNYQGTCAYTQCVCFRGYTGEDCSDTVDDEEVLKI